MSLDPSDIQPTGISLADAYLAIRTWYQANVSTADRRGDDYGRASAKLIRFLPPATKLSETEQRAVLREIILGYLEWGFHQSDSLCKMGAYAYSAFGGYKHSSFPNIPSENEILLAQPWRLNAAENECLATSELFPYLSPAHK